MTLQNGDAQRKSSVYNQTGQNHFEQLSSYNRMSSHLRRILMAQSVVEARNKKYLREKRASSRSSTGSKSLDQILSRREFIDGVAYDTEHHPVDLLRMRLGCDPNCLHMARKQSLEQSYRSCGNIRCRGGSPRSSSRPEMASGVGRYSRTSECVSPNVQNRSYGASRSSMLTGGRIDRQPEVEDSRKKMSEAPRSELNNRKGRGFKAINETYSYDSSFESSSDTSGIDSPVARNNCGCAPARANFHSSPQRTGSKKKDNKFPATVDRCEEAKYAKFLYNLTQEIVLKGLYTDRELHEVFKKHVEMNCGCLDKERMYREINQLKLSLNVREFSENKEKTKPSGDSSRRPWSAQLAAKNDILLMGTGRDVLVSEREVLVTLMEMKLDPEQVRTICRNLRNKIKETGMGRTPDEESKKITENCECQCREKAATSGPSTEEKQAVNVSKKVEESQTDEKTPQVVSQASQVEGQSKEVATSIYEREMHKETRSNLSSNSELQKLQRVIEEPKKSDEIVAESKPTDFSLDDVTKSPKNSLQSDDEEKRKIVAKNNSKDKKVSGTGKSTPERKRSLSPSHDRKSSKTKSVDLDKSQKKKDSTELSEARVVSDDEATTTEIATEKDSEQPQPEKIDEPTDDELPSLPEEISQVLDGSLSTINSEESQKSEPKVEAEKPTEIEPESSGEKRNETGESKGGEKPKSDKKSPGSSSPDTQRSKSPSRENSSTPQKGNRKSSASGSRTSAKQKDAGIRSPPISIELLRSRRPSGVSIRKEVGKDSMWEVMQPACNQPSVPCKRRKKYELMCSPCFAKQNRKSDFECAIERSVRACVREPIMSMFGEASLASAEREKSLQMSEAEEVSRSRDNVSAGQQEVQEDSAREKSIFPWLSENSGAVSRESQEKLDLSALPRRDTIHRRTSLIRSVRMAMESLKRLRRSSSVSSAQISAENLANMASTWPESSETLREENFNAKNSSRTSRSSVTPITLRSPRRSEEPKDKLSKASSFDASETLISADPEPRRFGRCRLDCRGPWSTWTHSGRHSRSPTDHGRRASQSSRGHHSKEDNEDNN